MKVSFMCKKDPNITMSKLFSPGESYRTVNTKIRLNIAEPHSSVGRFADLRTGGRWFDPRLGQYSFRGLMKVIATGFIPLSPLSIVATMVLWERILWESSQWLGKNMFVVLVKRSPGEHG